MCQGDGPRQSHGQKYTSSGIQVYQASKCMVLGVDEAMAGVGSVSVLIDFFKKGRESKPPESCKCCLHTVRNEMFGQCTLGTETEKKRSKVYFYKCSGSHF